MGSVGNLTEFYVNFVILESDISPWVQYMAVVYIFCPQFFPWPRVSSSKNKKHQNKQTKNNPSRYCRWSDSFLFPFFKENSSFLGSPASQPEHLCAWTSTSILFSPRYLECKLSSKPQVFICVLHMCIMEFSLVTMDFWNL